MRRDDATVVVGHTEFHRPREPSSSGFETRVSLDLVRSPAGYEGWRLTGKKGGETEENFR